MFEFICEKIVPGCSHEDRDEAQEELLERVAIHLREHHDLDHKDEPIAQSLRQMGVMFIKPV